MSGDMSGRVRVVAFGLRSLDGVDGGVETHARELYPRLAALGLDVCVLVRRRYAGPVGPWAGRGVRVRPLWAPRGRGVEAFGHAAVCAAYCLVTRPDVVHIHGIGPGALSGVLRRAGLRVVVTHHGHDYDAAKWGPLARLALRSGERRSVRDATAVIAVSRSIADALRRDLGARPVVVGNGVPAWSGGSHGAPAGRLAALAAAPFVLVVGRLTEHKRVADVIDAVGSVPDLRLVVCGDLHTTDPYAATVRRAAYGNDRVVLAGHVDPADLGWLYRRAACTVLASSYEGMPLAVLEAISAGCPVLLSDIPAHLELGLAPFQYFPVGDVAGLAGRLAAIVGRPRDRATAVQSRRVAEPRFDWAHIARETAAILRGAARDAPTVVPAVPVAVR